MPPSLQWVRKPKKQPGELFSVDIMPRRPFTAEGLGPLARFSVCPIMDL